MNIGEILVAALTNAFFTGCVLAALAFLGRSIIERWITRDLERYKAELQVANIAEIEKLRAELKLDALKREKAAAIAEFVSLWIARKYDPSLDQNKNRWNVQRKYWELSLWLDTKMLRLLNQAITGEGPSKYKEAFAEVRKYIVGEMDDDITPEEIVVWEPVESPEAER